MLDDTSADRVAAEVRRPDRLRPSVAWLRDWVQWFGPGRLIATAIAIGGVAFAGWWLVRSPATPTEAVLPMASAPTVPVSLPAGSTPPSTSGGLTVHVAGAVRRPGVYRIATGSRVVDAIERAGGAGPRADADALNLAAEIVDGSRVYVPRSGELAPAEPSTGLPVAPSADGSTSAGSTPVGPVDLNQADEAELEGLPGVGPATAEAIVEYRTANGPFATVDDLESVPGIGPAKLDAVRDLVTL